MDPFENVCRICLKDEGLQLLVFTKASTSAPNYRSTALGTIFTECLSLKALLLPSGAPNRLCGNCEEILLSYHAFRKQAVDSEKKILKSLMLNVLDPLRFVIKEDEHEEIEIKYSDLENNSSTEDSIKFENIDTEEMIYKSPVDKSEDFDTVYLEEEHLEEDNKDFDHIEHLDDDEDSNSSRDNFQTVVVTSYSDDSNHHESDANMKAVSRESQPDSKTQNVVQKTCSRCDFTFTSNAQRVQHFREKHHFVCHICNTKFQTEKVFQAHKRVHENRTNPWKCDMCSKELSTPHTYVAHMEIHKGTLRHHCDQCKYSCARRSDFDIHKVSHSLERKHLCDLCGKSYSTRSGLACHRRYGHTAAKMVSCAYCETNFQNPNSMRAHVRAVHKKEQYECEICSKIFNRKDHLRQHSKTHKNNKKTSEKDVDDNFEDN